MSKMASQEEYNAGLPTEVATAMRGESVESNTAGESEFGEALARGEQRWNAIKDGVSSLWEKRKSIGTLAKRALGTPHREMFPDVTERGEALWEHSTRAASSFRNLFERAGYQLGAAAEGEEQRVEEEVNQTEAGFKQKLRNSVGRYTERFQEHPDVRRLQAKYHETRLIPLAIDDRINEYDKRWWSAKASWEMAKAGIVGTIGELVGGFETEEDEETAPSQTIQEALARMNGWEQRMFEYRGKALAFRDVAHNRQQTRDNIITQRAEILELVENLRTTPITQEDEADARYEKARNVSPTELAPRGEVA